MYYETLYNFCLTSSIDNLQIHFNPNGEDTNGYNCWISDDLLYSINWNTSISKWEVTGGELPYSMFSLSSYPPLNAWYILGKNGFLYANEGICNTVNTTSLRYSLNHPNCSCDGSITLQITNGLPPFQYSINLGVTYQNSPIFTNLCSGTYGIKVIDSMGNVYTQSVILNKMISPTIYTLKLNTTETTSVNSSSTLSKNYVSTLVITPELPNGVSLNLDLTHNNNFYSSPLSGTSNQITNTLVTINDVVIGISSENIITDNHNFNTTPGCQLNQLFYTGLTDSWTGLTVTNSDVVKFLTTSTINKSLPLTICSVGKSDESYNISNVTISGCGCCNFRIVN
jgi:hypothetical protein